VTEVPMPARHRSTLDFLATHRALLLFVSVGITLAVTLPTALRTRTFTSRASFAPVSSGGSASRLAGLASQLGVAVNVGMGDDASNPEVYVALARSRPFRLALAADTYWRVSGRDTARAPLAALLDINEDSDDETTEAVLRELNNIFTVETAMKSGLVQIIVRSPGSHLSQQLVERALSLVNEFTLRNRRERAAAEREFASERLLDASSQVRSSEEQLLTFMRGNRALGGAPLLQLQYERLKREVDLQRNVYGALAQSYAQASIEQERRVPLISVVERPVASYQSDPRGLAMRLVVGLLTGALLAVGLAFLREYFFGA